MFPTHVALVAYDGSSPDLDELAQVAAALQVQVVRDFGPIWGIAGTVSPFHRLEDVPPGYLPLAIVRDELPFHSHGFHFSTAGVPFALVQYINGWALAASHELLEMLCDPTGQRTVLGPSLADEKLRGPIDAEEPPANRKANVVNDLDNDEKQGWVDYLVEVCDPCEHSTYEINGVEVADFVTPQYYGAVARPPSRYSFLGSITQPRQVLPGGYISWRTRVPQGLVYQAHNDPTQGLAERDKPARGADPIPAPVELTITQVSGVPSRMPRESIDFQRQRPADGTGSGSPPYYKADTSSERFADAVRTDIRELLNYLRLQQSQPSPDLDTIIDLVKRLAAEDGELLARFNNDTSVKADELEKVGAPRSASPKVLSKDEYRKVLGYLEQQKKLSGIFGPDLFRPGLALWMAMHIG